MLFHKYKKIIMVLISILILVAILTPLLYNYYTSDERIYHSNQNYPLYNLLDLSLNNETRGNITAQVLRFNDTTDNWEVNFALLEMIQNDLQPAVESIDNLDEIYLYSINRSSLPGKVYLLLSTEIKNSENAIQSLFSFISLNNAIFWYLQNVSFPVFDIAAMAFEGTLKYNAIIYMAIYTGHTFNNTNNYVCKELDGLIASPWIINESSWVKNTPFRELVTSDLTCFVDRIIEIEAYVYFNDYGSPEATFYDACISYNIRINYNQDSNRNQQFKNYFILYSIMERLWYVENIRHVIRA